VKQSAARNTIIETASTLFYRNGYNATGINEIIAESGVAKATLYHHFKSKEELCVEYLRFKNESFLSDISAFCKKKKQGEGQILALFNFLLTFFKQDDFNGCWCIKTIAEIPIDNEFVRKEIQRLKQAFIEFIEELVADNLGPGTTKGQRSLSRQIYLLYESAVAESHLHKNNWPIKEAKSLCIKIIN